MFLIPMCLSCTGLACIFPSIIIILSCPQCSAAVKFKPKTDFPLRFNCQKCNGDCAKKNQQRK